MADCHGLNWQSISHLDFQFKFLVSQISFAVNDFHETLTGYRWWSAGGSFKKGKSSFPRLHRDLIKKWQRQSSSVCLEVSSGPFGGHLTISKSSVDGEPREMLFRSPKLCARKPKRKSKISFWNPNLWCPNDQKPNGLLLDLLVDLINRHCWPAASWISLVDFLKERKNFWWCFVVWPTILWCRSAWVSLGFVSSAEGRRSSHLALLQLSKDASVKSDPSSMTDRSE